MRILKFYRIVFLDTIICVTHTQRRAGPERLENQSVIDQVSFEEKKKNLTRREIK